MTLRPVVAHFGAALGDQARAALAASVDPQPVDGDAEPVAQADQEVDVGDAPNPPCQRAAHLDPAEIDYRQPLADLRQIAGMLVDEWSNVAAGETRLDGAGDITALLFRGRSNTRHGIAIWVIDHHCVADGEYVRMAGNGEVGQHLQAPGA